MDKNLDELLARIKIEEQIYAYAICFGSEYRGRELPLYKVE